MKNLFKKISIVLLVGFSLQANANSYSLAFSCLDDQGGLALYVYQSEIFGVADKIVFKNLETGEITFKKLYLTISASNEQIMVWNRPNNHGGSSIIFSANLIEGVLTGHGFGLLDAECRL